MAKTFFKLTGAYEGLQARRLKWSGRLVFYQIINDGAPYWLVQIQNFDPAKDRAPGIIDPAKTGNWRFVDLQAANQKYEQLAPFSPPRIYTVPLNSPARMAELRARKGKSLRRTEQGADLVSNISQALKKPFMPVDQYIAEMMEEATK